MYTVETTLENEYLDNLDALSAERTERVKRIEALEFELYVTKNMIKTLDEKMQTMSEKYHQDVVSTVEAALAQ